MTEHAAGESLITVQQAADLLGVSERTVERMQAAGELTPVYLVVKRRTKLRRFRRSDVESRTTGSPAEVSA